MLPGGVPKFFPVEKSKLSQEEPPHTRPERVGGLNIKQHDFNLLLAEL